MQSYLSKVKYTGLGIYKKRSDGKSISDSISNIKQVVSEKRFSLKLIVVVSIRLQHVVAEYITFVHLTVVPNT